MPSRDFFCARIVPLFLALSVVGCDPVTSPPSRTPESLLRDIFYAEDELRRKDLDGNGINDYWVADVASLHFRQGTNDSPLKLVSFQLACADVSARHDTWGKNQPISPVPFFDHFVQAMKTDGSGGNYAPQGVHFNSGSFGFCAFPARYGTSTKSTYIIDHTGQIWAADLGGKPIQSWPTAQELDRSWTKKAQIR